MRPTLVSSILAWQLHRCVHCYICRSQFVASILPHKIWRNLHRRGGSFGMILENQRVEFIWGYSCSRNDNQSFAVEHVDRSPCSRERQQCFRINTNNWVILSSTLRVQISNKLEVFVPLQFQSGDLDTTISLNVGSRPLSI
jgi:hypothetical protein